MAQVFNIYCDESCHLEHDRQGIMVLGAIWYPFEKARETARSIRNIKEQVGSRHPSISRTGFLSLEFGRFVPP